MGRRQGARSVGKSALGWLREGWQRGRNEGPLGPVCDEERDEKNHNSNEVSLVVNLSIVYFVKNFLCVFSRGSSWGFGVVFFR